MSIVNVGDTTSRSGWPRIDNDQKFITILIAAFTSFVYVMYDSELTDTPPKELPSFRTRYIPHKR